MTLSLRLSPLIFGENQRSSVLCWLVASTERSECVQSSFLCRLGWAVCAKPNDHL